MEPSIAWATDPDDTDTTYRDPEVCKAPKPCPCPKCSGGATDSNTLAR